MRGLRAGDLPITAAIDLIPYLGILIGLAWMAFIYVCASVEVHGIKPKTAWIVFGALFVILAVRLYFNCSTPREASSIKWTRLEKSLSEIEKMKPGEAGQAVGEFLKGMEKGINKK